MYRTLIVSLCVQFGFGRNRALIIGRSARDDDITIGTGRMG